MKILFGTVPLFLFCLLFFSDHTEAASPCKIKNNQVTWEGAAVSLEVNGRVKVLKNKEYVYIKNSDGKLISTKKQLNPKSFKLVYSKIKNGSSYYFQTRTNEFLKASSNLQYEVIPSTVKQCVEDKNFKDTTNQIISEAKKQKTTFGKVLYVQEAVINKTTYDRNGTYAFDPKGPFVYGNGVCEGYSYAVNYILMKLNIPSKIVGSYKMNHAWNLIKLDNQWYHLDATWSDSGSTSNYAYILQSDKGFKNNQHYGWDIYNDFSEWDPWDGWNYNDTIIPKAASEKYKYLSVMANKSDNITTDFQNFYYINRNDENRLWKMSLDGKTNKRLTNHMVEDVLYIKNSLYLLNSNEIGEFFISTMNTDGTKKKEIKKYNGLRDGNVYKFYMKNSNVYFELNDQIKTVTNFK